MRLAGAGGGEWKRNEPTLGVMHQMLRDGVGLRSLNVGVANANRGACMRLIMVLCGVVLLLAGAGGLGGCRGKTDLSIQYWQANQAIAKVAQLSKDPDALAIIDVRAREEFARERIAGARNMTIAEFATPSIRDAKAPGEVVIAGKDEILIYANDPGSAVPRAMAKRLMRMGYEDVYVLQGGLLAWKRAGGGVVEGGEVTGGEMRR